MKTKKIIDLFDEKDILIHQTKIPEEDNRYITETAGYVPLEVKFKQFEQNGLTAQFLMSDFDSNDYRDIYLNPDFNITPEDDLEDVEAKITARNDYIEKLKKSKVGNFEKIADPPSGSAAADKQKNDFVEKSE